MSNNLQTLKKNIKVSNGFVEGSVKKIIGEDIVEFLSIPYCIAPTNERRFKRPENSSFVERIINHCEFKTCPPQLALQVNEESNEDEDMWIPKEQQSDDCLYVNIWCPLKILEGKDKCAVFVWIYGGGFISGSSSLPIYNGSILAAKENIIVVSFNYRVGMLGFLCLDEEINGNQGIWDQVMALEWIHENIENFQGNSNNITLAGNSAGGCSVTLHLIIENSWNYFNKIIAQSGVCFSDWGFLPKSELINRSEKIVNKLLEKYNIPQKWNKFLNKDEKNKIIKILQNMDFKEFLRDSEIVEGILNFAWTPCIDGVLIKDDPKNLFKNKKHKICPTIFLNVENEGTYFLLLEFPKLVIDENECVDNCYLDKCLKYYPYYPKLCSSSIKDKVIEKYKLGSQKIKISDLDKILSHRHFVADSIKLANCVSDSFSKVYYLWFRTLSPHPAWPSWVGIMHSDEVYYLFGNSFLQNDHFDNSCVQFMSHIGNFINYGSFSKELPLYDSESRQYILIENDKWNPQKFKDDEIEKFTFWMELRKEFQ